MKTLIINEPFVKDFCRTQRWAARTRGRVLRAPDWLAYATAVLEKEGCEAQLYDFPAKGWDKDHLRELVKKEQPEIVLLDSTTPRYILISNVRTFANRLHPVRSLWLAPMYQLWTKRH